MTDRLILSVWEPVMAHRMLTDRLWPTLKAMLMAGQRMVIELRQEKRSDAENRMLHAMLGHISKNFQWAGAKRDTETWKRLLTAAWLRARGEHVEMLPALDGHGVDIVFRRTSSLTRKECAELIEFIFAWGCENDIEFPAPDSLEAPRKPSELVVDAETGEIL